MDDILTQEQIDKWPPELQPVLKRHGLELMNFCLILAGTNHAIDEIIELGEKFQDARMPGRVLMHNVTTLYEEILKYKGWRMERVIECVEDIGRAQALAPVEKRIIH